MRFARGLKFALLLVLATPMLAGARVFSYKDAGVAAYLRGTAGQIYEVRAFEVRKLMTRARVKWAASVCSSSKIERSVVQCSNIEPPDPARLLLTPRGCIK